MAAANTEVKKAKRQVVLCMGSACFARGNGHLAQALQRYLKAEGLEQVVSITGTLCQNKCHEGPHLCVDGECHCEMTVEKLKALLAGKAIPEGR